MSYQTPMPVSGEHFFSKTPVYRSAHRHDVLGNRYYSLGEVSPRLQTARRRSTNRLLPGSAFATFFTSAST